MAKAEALGIKVDYCRYQLGLIPLLAEFLDRFSRGKQNRKMGCPIQYETVLASFLCGKKMDPSKKKI